MATDEKKKVKFSTKLKKVMQYIWNSERQEFFGRDGERWAKVAAFYVVFYSCLAAFFIAMVAVLAAVTPRNRPKYFLENSTMSVLDPVNPGVGFRPHLEVDNELIAFDVNLRDNDKWSPRHYVNNLRGFLKEKYSATSDDDPFLERCATNTEPSPGKSCVFDFPASECSLANAYGYTEGKPCVLIKLNKLIGWKSGGMPRCPTDTEKSDGKGSLGSGGDIRIKCTGEYPADRDNIKSVTYFSYNGKSSECGGIPNSKSYYPFDGQRNYQSPYVWVKLEVEPNILISFICRAHADNIDNIDRLRMRGMTRLKLFIRNITSP